MSATTSTAQIFIKLPQYTEETTEGTTPSSATFITCGSVESISLNIDETFVDISQLGSEDLLSIVPSLNKCEFKIKAYLVNSTFLKYGVKAANVATPTGTISAPLSILWSTYLNGVENFIIAKGCKIKEVKLDFEAGKPDTVEYTVVAVNIAMPSATGAPGSPSYASNPTGPVWGHLDGGANPASWNGTGLNAKKCTITINRNSTADFTLGNSNAYGIQPHGRRISFEIMNLWTSTTLESDYRGGTTRTFTYTIKSATSTITFTNAYITGYKRDTDANSTEAVGEQLAGRATAITVT